MKMKFGAIVVDGRGKIGGHVASKNRGGAYLRTKVTPVNAQTSFQNGVRNLFTSLSQAWRGLTEEQRAAWNAAVADYQRTNIFGDTHSPTGFNLYQRLNNNLITIGEDALDVPPLPSAVGEVVATGLLVTSDIPSMSLVLAGEVPAQTAVKVFATAPVSAGKSFVKSEYRQISVLAPAATTPVDLKPAYVAKFGSTGISGQKIFVKVVAVNSATGQEGTPSSISAIVVHAL
jgi:hypothetical protein